MGIQGLSKLIADCAAAAIREYDIKNYHGRKIAIDASMCIYQFLIAVRQDGSQLVNESGETTSHLMGMFYRTIRMFENGIKPVYVFDGKPPQMKSHELSKRTERRAEAEKEHQKAVEEGDKATVDKFSRRLVKVTKEHNAECKKLLDLMGVPYVDAPCEAEAQCAEMVRGGLVYATATEDMDALTFGSEVLLRHVTASEAKKLPIKEYSFAKLLSEAKLEKDEFIDLCILLGCDYCGSIRGIGPKRAVELIKEHRNIETILKHIDTNKYAVPEGWQYKEARELFKAPEITDASEITLKWKDPDIEGLVEFMVKEKNFNEDRIRNGAAKLTKAKNTAQQGRIDSFFKCTGVTTTKRKIEDKPDKSKKAKKGGGGKFKGKLH